MSIFYIMSEEVSEGDLVNIIQNSKVIDTGVILYKYDIVKTNELEKHLNHSYIFLITLNKIKTAIKNAGIFFKNIINNDTGNKSIIKIKIYKLNDMMDTKDGYYKTVQKIKNDENLRKYIIKTSINDKDIIFNKIGDGNNKPYIVDEYIDKNGLNNDEYDNLINNIENEKLMEKANEIASTIRINASKNSLRSPYSGGKKSHRKSKRTRKHKKRTRKSRK